MTSRGGASALGNFVFATTDSLCPTRPRLSRVRLGETQPSNPMRLVRLLSLYGSQAVNLSLSTALVRINQQQGP